VKKQISLPVLKVLLNPFLLPLPSLEDFRRLGNHHAALEPSIPPWKPSSLTPRRRLHAQTSSPFTKRVCGGEIACLSKLWKRIRMLVLEGGGGRLHVCLGSDISGPHGRWCQKPVGGPWGSEASVRGARFSGDVDMVGGVYPKSECDGQEYFKMGFGIAGFRKRTPKSMAQDLRVRGLCRLSIPNGPEFNSAATKTTTLSLVWLRARSRRTICILEFFQFLGIWIMAIPSNNQDRDGPGTTLPPLKYCGTRC
jgi:hypothetical protein